jgi:hypothetical protein
MSLYLCIFDGDDDLDGVDVGGYADFNALRDVVVKNLELGYPGSRFPTFVLHADCDGEWTPNECRSLIVELEQIEEEMKEREALPFPSEWQSTVAHLLGLKPKSSFESFLDVDGEFLIERILSLARKASSRSLPITFQ